MERQEFVGEEFNADAREALAAIPDDQPFGVINLLRYKTWAEYPPGVVSERLTGQQAYEKYAELSIPFVNKVGGVPMWRGDFAVTLIGPEPVPWDEIVIMQYPARSAFETMLDDPEYRKTLVHRTAAVRDSRLVGATSAQGIGPMKWKLFNLTRRLGLSD
ncbi:DUF1330 domain-containing protein [Tropicimonas marinistellae]|uniref:DUF1330 domain-containing protein n=1 Tax=Tropicimonas marinistellae TaxID=1739787 RepID=UPI00082D687C|nr:DUF1330 domain-containing protein [Tropicimonas marinistellae]